MPARRGWESVFGGSEAPAGCRIDRMVRISDLNRIWLSDHFHFTLCRMGQLRTRWMPVLLAASCAIAWGQARSMSDGLRRDYRGIRDYFLRAAEKMPEAEYGFRPSPDVRSF